MGHVDVNAVSYSLPDGRPLLDEVSLRVGEGAKVALIGPNGTGKTSLLRIVSGDLASTDGAITRSGGLGVMRQFIGKVRDDTSVRDLLVSVAPEPIRAGRGRGRGGRARDDGARRRAGPDGLRAGAGRLGRRRRLRARDAVGRLHGRRARHRRSSRPSGATSARCPAASRSGWSSRRCCAAPRTCCCWTSRTTTSTCRPSAGSRSADRLAQDGAVRQPRPRAAGPGRDPDRDAGADGRPGRRSGCTRGASRPTHQARVDRNSRLEELRRRWDEEHAKLKALVVMYRQKASYNSGHGRPSCRRRRPGCDGSSRPARRRCCRSSRACGCG